MHHKKVHSSPGLGHLSQLFLAWPSWTTTALVFFLIGLYNGSWIIRNFLLPRLSAVFQSVDLCCWLVFCLGFFPHLDRCQDGLFFFKFIFCFGTWKLSQSSVRGRSVGFHGHRDVPGCPVLPWSYISQLQQQNACREFQNSFFFYGLPFEYVPNT